jgi:F0F1-type ATP synthase assembly protein I
MLGEYTTLAMSLPVSTLLGYAMGYGLDKLFGTKFLYIIFLILGSAAGMMQIVKKLLKDARDDDKS